MKNLNFQQLTLKNFKQYKKETTVNLELPGVTFLRGRNLKDPQLGSNDCGKSTIWSALLWCLYGTTTDGLHNPDIIPWNGNREQLTYVTLKLNVAGKPYTIQRIVSPSKLLLNRTAVSQERIIKLIGMTRPTFLHTILFGQDKPLFFDLKPKEKMDRFSEILELDRWEGRSTETALKVTSFIQRQSAFEFMLEGFVRQKEETNKILDDVQAQSDAWKKENSKVFESIAADIEVEKNKLEELKDQLSTADISYDSAMTECKALENEFNANLIAIDKARQTFQLEDDKRRSIMAEANYITKELAKLDTKGKCPTCGQPISGTTLHNHIDKMKKDREIKLKNATLWPTKKAIELCDDLRNKRDLLRDHIKKFRDTADAFHETQLKIISKVAEVTARIQYLDECQTNRPTNPHKIRIRDINLQIAQIDKNIEDTKKKSRILERVTARNRRWVKGYKDIRLYLIEEVLQELTLVTAGMLDTVGLIGWKIKYTIEKETKSGNTQQGLYILISSPTNVKPVKWESWSGGIAQRLRLIGALAFGQVLLNRAGVATNLQILDEPTRSLSSEGVDSLCRLLADYARNTDTSIWFIDHHAIESNSFSSYVTVTKDKTGVSIQ